MEQEYNFIDAHLHKLKHKKNWKETETQQNFLN